MTDIVKDSSKPTFFYWKVAARAQTPMLMLHAAKIPYEWDDKVSTNVLIYNQLNSLRP